MTAMKNDELITKSLEGGAAFTTGLLPAPSGDHMPAYYQLGIGTKIYHTRKPI